MSSNLRASFKSKTSLGVTFMFSSENIKHRISSDKEININFRSTFCSEVLWKRGGKLKK